MSDVSRRVTACDGLGRIDKNSTLCSHGMNSATLQIIFKSVAVAKLVYAASAWYGFCTAADRDRFEAVIRRGKRSGFCPVDLPC